MAAFRAWQILILVIFEALPPDMVVAIADLAPQTRELAQLVTRHTLVRLQIQSLTAGLMLELVVLTQMPIAERTEINSTTVIPHSSLAFRAFCVLQRAFAAMGGYTVGSVAYPRLAVVTNGADHGHASGIDSSMLN